MRYTPEELRTLIRDLDDDLHALRETVTKLNGKVMSLRLLAGDEAPARPVKMPLRWVEIPPVRDLHPISKMTTAHRGRDTVRCEVCREPAPVVIALGRLWACSRCVMLGESEAVKAAEMAKARGKR